MYGLSFVASLFWASATLRFASAIRLPTSSAKCADAAEGPGLRGCAGTGVLEAAEADPERMAASFAAISARFCAISASFYRTKSESGTFGIAKKETGTYIVESIRSMRGSLGAEKVIEASQKRILTAVFTLRSEEHTLNSSHSSPSRMPSSA